ncbi:hypothetical protein BDR05DRAFT_1012891 [Suillus weaverae]|nr:hypothetical protein BDR05DRAFT_1012891 [Suillus weaverae]
MDFATNPGEIDDIPDLDGGGLASVIADVSIVSETGATVGETPDLDNISDMEEEGLEEGEDEATAALVVPKVGGVLDALQVGVANGNLLQVRTYDVMITYQTPRIWLLSYDENHTFLMPAQIFQDISTDHTLKTVTFSWARECTKFKPTPPPPTIAGPPTPSLSPKDNFNLKAVDTSNLESIESEKDEDDEEVDSDGVPIKPSHKRTVTHCPGPRSRSDVGHVTLSNTRAQWSDPLRWSKSDNVQLQPSFNITSCPPH